MNHTGNAVSRSSPLSALSRAEWLCLALVVLAHVLPVCWLLCGSVTDPPEMTPPIAGVLVSGSGGTGGGATGRAGDGLPGHKERGKTTHDQGKAASAPKTAMVKKPLPSRAERAMANRTAVSQTSPSVASSVTQSHDAATTATDKNVAGGAGLQATSGGTGKGGNELSGNGNGSGTGGSGHGSGSGNGFSGPDGSGFSNPKPPYPAISRRMGEEGLVVLSVYILADGTVGEVSIKKSSGFRRLDESALKTVRRWRYAPAKRHGKPVAIRYTQPIRFSLND